MLLKTLNLSVIVWKTNWGKKRKMLLNIVLFGLSSIFIEKKTTGFFSTVDIKKNASGPYPSAVLNSGLILILKFQASDWLRQNSLLQKLQCLLGHKYCTCILMHFLSKYRRSLKKKTVWISHTILLTPTIWDDNFMSLTYSICFSKAFKLFQMVYISITFTSF